MDTDRKLLSHRHFWIVAVMLIICGFFHYFAPQVPLLRASAFPTTRQAVVRIIFLLPVAAAAFAFGRSGGLITLALATLIMLPRIVFVSDQPLDALFETVGVVVVGWILVWMIDVQEREKRLRQRAVEQLETVNAIALTLTQSRDLETMLDQALRRVLDVAGLPSPRGAILTLDPWGQTLSLRAQQGLCPGFAERAHDVPLEECLCGLTADSGEVMVVYDALNHPRHTRCLEKAPHTHVCVPLISKDRLLGVMDFYLPATYPVDAVDREMFGAIGRQVGVAVENARLCENLRFYVGQITEAQEEERKRVARELHDDTAQRLIALSRHLDALSGDEERLSEEGTERLERLQAEIEDALKGVRRFSRDLRPSILDDLGLIPALEGLLSNLKEDGLTTQLRASGARNRLSPDVELALYRIAQEALNNVKKHAQASRVVIDVGFDADRVRLSVSDDGRGFQQLKGGTSDYALASRFGLLGIEERAQLLQGHFHLRSGEGEGTTVGVDVPIGDGRA
jgi:signal transduction histidine kinase